MHSSHPIVEKLDPCAKIHTVTTTPLRRTARYPTARKVLYLFHIGRSVPHIFMVKFSPARPVIEQDITRWLKEWHHDEWLHRPSWTALVWLIWRYPEFRNLLYFRVEQAYDPVSRLLLEIAKRLYRRLNTLLIANATIGPGLFIQHGFSTAIVAKSLGRNCWVNQQVTIGYSQRDDDCPVIGDNVQVFAGAKVFGKITIGDNVRIGANAVVCKNVPPNCTVVGVPAHIVRRDGRRVHELL